MAFAQFQSTEFWPNGKKLSDGQYTSDPGILSTDTKEVSADKLSRVTKIGDWTYWFENGKVSAEEHYNTSGQPTSTWKTWYLNGVQSSNINFQLGAASFWYESGQKSSEGSMAPGMIQTGRWIGWHENGQKNYEGTYDNDGHQIGVWTFWNAQGRKIAEQTYNNGTLIETKNFE